MWVCCGWWPKLQRKSSSRNLVNEYRMSGRKETGYSPPARHATSTLIPENLRPSRAGVATRFPGLRPLTPSKRSKPAAGKSNMFPPAGSQLGLKELHPQSALLSARRVLVTLEDFAAAYLRYCRAHVHGRHKHYCLPISTCCNYSAKSATNGLACQLNLWLESPGTEISSCTATDASSDWVLCILNSILCGHVNSIEVNAQRSRARSNIVRLPSWEWFWLCRRCSLYWIKRGIKLTPTRLSMESRLIRPLTRQQTDAAEITPGTGESKLSKYNLGGTSSAAWGQRWNLAPPGMNDGTKHAGDY